MDNNIRFVVGTGGVGKGILFRLEGGENLGRNESRSAELTDFKDFCKLHIIMHYVALFNDEKLPIYAISSVGNDDAGAEVKDLMCKIGMNVDYIREHNDKRTLFSVCYQFPTGEGGNITTNNGANDSITEQDIVNFFQENESLTDGLVLAAPEVPISVRQKLLSLGRKRNCFNTASLLPVEAKDFITNGIFSDVDLLAINSDEADAIAAVAKIDIKDDPKKLHEYLKSFNENIILVLTMGRNGALTFFGNKMSNNGIIETPVVSTAGAGDCFLGTIISCTIKGIPLFSDETGDVATAQGVATLVSSIKVGCSDTIDFDMTKKAVFDFANKHNISFSKTVLNKFFNL